MRRRRWAYGALAAVALYSLLVAGWVPSPVAVVLGAALLLLIPTASSCARRIALNSAIVVGWSQVLWWVDWPVPVNHGAVIAAAAAGYLVVVVSGASSPRRKAVDVLPRFRPVDALLAGAVVATTAAMWRWVTASTPQRALEVLLPGADNYAHFHMFSTLRAYGATTTSLPPAPDGSGWGFDEYPQGFHALVATVSELVGPRLTPGPDALVAYALAVPLVVALGVVMITAATVSLPRVQDRPELAAPAVVLTWTAFLWEPGQNLLADGFANFGLAAAAAASALLLALNGPRDLRLVELAAIGGLLMFVTHAWAPLVVIAAPAALVVLLRWMASGDAGRSRRRVLAAGAVVVACALGMGKAFVTLLTQVDVSTVVTAFGGIHGTRPLPTFVLIVVAFYVCAGYRRWAARAAQTDDQDLDLARRVRVLSLAPLLGLTSAAMLFIAQLRTVGTTSYYFLKYLMGFELILAAFVPAVVALALAAVWPRPVRRSWTIVATVTAMVLATQAYGRFPRSDPALLADDHSGTASVGAPFSAERIARGVLSAVGSTSREEAFNRDYVAIGPARAAEAFYPDGWYHGTLPTLTRDVQERVDVLRHRADTVQEAAPLVRRLLLAHPSLEIVVDPQYAPALRARMSTGDLARRVVGWRPVGSVESEGEGGLEIVL